MFRFSKEDSDLLQLEVNVTVLIKPCNIAEIFSERFEAVRSNFCFGTSSSVN
jgi:hypothetical protein